LYFENYLNGEINYLSANFFHGKSFNQEWFFTSEIPPHPSLATGLL